LADRFALALNSAASPREERLHVGDDGGKPDRLATNSPHSRIVLAKPLRQLCEPRGDATRSPSGPVVRLR